jgi:ubiquinol-cytochrome c reductase cytochrome b subunit
VPRLVRDWLEDRTGLPSALDRCFEHPIPGGARLWHALGATAAFLILLEFVTGIFLAFYYSPSATAAWASTAFIQDGLTLGWFVRGLHSFGSAALIVVTGLHLLQVLIIGAYKKPRELNWILGLLMLLLVVGFAISGYGLPWDQAGYWAKLVETSIIGTSPVIGPVLERIMQGGSRYGNYTVVHFYALHVFVLPAALMALLVLHIRLSRRHGLTPHWRMTPAAVVARTEPYFPGQAFRDVALSAATLAVVAFMVWTKHGASLEGPADPASTYMARPEWYAIPLYQLRMYFEGPAEIVATMIIPGIAGGLAMALPFIDRSPVRDPMKRMPVMMGTAAGLVGMTVLSGLAMRKDAGDPAFQKFRAKVEQEAAAARMWARQGVLPEGGTAVFKNDPEYQVRALFAEKCGNCHALTGQGGDEGPDFRDYNSRAWILGFLKDPQGPLYMGPAKKGDKGMKPVEGTPEEVAMLAELVYAETGAKDVDVKLVEAAREKDLFSEKDCDSCHYIGEEDMELGNSGPNLFGRGNLAYVVRVIEDPAHERLYGDKAKMPDFGGKLTPAQIEALAKFVIAQKISPAKN